MMPNSPAAVKLMPNFSINNGKMGAKKEEYISCRRCERPIIITFPDWNLVFLEFCLNSGIGFEVCAGAFIVQKSIHA